MDEVVKRLQDICGPEHVSDALVDRLAYRRDCGPTPGGIPGYVVRPESTDEVVALVKLANDLDKPIFLWGRATTFVDHGIYDGAIIMALDLINKFEIDIENQVVHAQTGAIWHAIDAELKTLGWELKALGGGGMFSASVGGTVAYNAVPHALTEYGMTGDQVISLEVVLADGTIIHTGSAANEAAGRRAIERGANGPDLTGLFIGSCGTLGIITEATLPIRRIPEIEEFLFYAFDELDQIVDAVSAIQKQSAATFLVGLFGGPKPADTLGNYFLHIIIRDRKSSAGDRRYACEVACETYGGMKQDPIGTRRYWVGHMFSWLRNTPPEAYYGSRPMYCPEVSGFLPTQSLKEVIPALHGYVEDHQEDFERYGIRVKGLDVYFSPNAAFLWVDTLYDESDVDAHQFGIQLRADIAELLYSQWMSPGGIVSGIAPYIMEKLGSTYGLMKTLKGALDPKHILNPGVLLLGGGQPEARSIPAAREEGHAVERLNIHLYECLRCAFCFDLSWLGPVNLCPSYAYGAFETHAARGRIAVARAFVEGELELDESVADRIFSCTLCRSCGEHCLKQIDTWEIFLAMREDLARAGLTPPGLKAAAEMTIKSKNLYGKEHGERFSWLKDRDLLDRPAKTALFVGCTPSYVRRGLARDGVALMKKMGIDFTLASDEQCCSVPLMAAGEPMAEFMIHNMNTYQDLGVERMVFICPECMESFRSMMPKVLGDPLPFETMHLIELVTEQVERGRVEFDVLAPGTVVTYHDPCTLGRGLGIYQAPRDVISAMPGMRLAEMPRHGRDSYCCGAGGLVRYDYPELADTAGLDRWNEAINTGAGILLTTCPACLTQFQKMRVHQKASLEVMSLFSLINRLVRVK